MKNLQKEFTRNIAIGLMSVVVLLVLLYKGITNYIINQEINKLRLEANTLIYYRHYLAKVAPYVKTNNLYDKLKITPAYVTNQVAKDLRKNENFYVRQVSDKYRNPNDKPNQYELKIINYFKNNKNAKEFYEFNSKNISFKEKNIYYAKPLFIQKSCLKCHGDPKKDVPPKLYKKLIKLYGNKAFGYKIGDLRGIISLDVPYSNIIDEINRIFLYLVILLCLFIIITIYLFIRLGKNIKNDINKILNHFKNMKNYKTIKENFNFIEFKELSKIINNAIIQLKKSQGKLYAKLYFNSLTNLANRNKFLEDIETKEYPIVIINIDKFKEINIYFGEKIADKLIIEVANRLKKYKKHLNYKVYHLSIDEFGLLFKDKDLTESQLKYVLNHLLSLLAKIYYIESNEILIRFRMGISFYKREYLRATSALDAAKELKKDIVFAKDSRYLDKTKEHLEWLKKLQIAMQNDKIVPFFQPIVDKNKNIIKYESLVRLIDEDGKIISPFFFLDVAKKSRLYLKLTKRMFNKSIALMNQKNVALSLNLTLEDIEDEEMRKFIFKKISEVKKKSLLTIEIVESEDVKENELVKNFLDKIKKEGVLLYIDDFGSGYSNFDYIIKLLPDGVKIDGSLIKNILTDKNSQIIVKTIISFAKQMNIKIIAEFVENEEIFEMLKEMGVDYFQGYYFSPPKGEI